MDFWISFANFFASAIRLTAPIALGTLACTISERAGVINIGIEGSMLFSGFLAAVGSYYTGSPWVGLLCGCAAGAFLALILGVLAIYCNGQQIVIGIGLNLFGPGFAYMLMRALWDTTGISPWVEGFQAVNIPLLSRIPIAGTMLSGYPACIGGGYAVSAASNRMGPADSCRGRKPRRRGHAGHQCLPPANACGASGRRFCRHGRRCHVPQLRQCVCQ